MALVFNDRVKETSTTTGTGTLTLDGAVTGFETFSSAIGNTNTTYYAIELPNTAEFEVGLGTVSAGQLARTQVFSSSNSDALVDFSAGTKNVFCTLPASKFVPGKLEGTDFTNSLLIGHATTGTLSGAENNTGVGIGALDAITSGDRNVALGTSALTSLTSGLGNVAVGHTALTSIASGLGNTGIGEYALNNTTGNRNTGVGSGSLFSVGNASWNTGLGVDSGRSISTGNYNIAIGYDSGDNITSGDGNVIIGTVDADSATGDRQLKITGYDGTTTTTWISGDSSGNLTFPADLTVDTDTLYVDSSNNRVGIGTTSPTQALTIGGDANSVLISSNDYDLIKLGPRATSGANLDRSIFQMYSSGVEINRLDAVGNNYINGGNLGIGTSSPSTLLHLSSSDPQITITDTDGTGSQVIKAVTDNLEIISSNHIKFDADSGLFAFKDSGTDVFSITNTGNIIFKTVVSDSDLLIRGNDGGSEITALTLDMSEAGAATFNDKVTLGANKVIEFGDAGENISGDGTSLTIASSHNTVLDSANDIFLDAGNGNVYFRDDGTLIGQLLRSGANDFKIKALQNGKDMVLEGLDSGGSLVQALTLDMSSAGAATFNDKVILGANKVIEFGDAGETISGDGTSLTTTGGNIISIAEIKHLFRGNTIDIVNGSGVEVANIQSSTSDLSIDAAVQDKDLIFKGNDGGSQITALTLDMSEAGAATFNSSVTVGGNLDVSSGTIKLDGNYPTGTNNVALGDNALDSVTTGGNDNTMIGDNAGTAVTTGYQNTAVGSTALNTGNATGNTAIGYRALRRATGANNTGIGRSAGDDTTTGGQNTFVGGSAGYYINGINNVAVGYQAGQGFGNTGSSNIFIGYRAGDNITSGSNNIVIGTNIDASSATVSNEITLGDANITSLRIPGLQSGASSGDVLTYDGTNITLSTPSTGVSAGFAVAMAIAL